MEQLSLPASIHDLSVAWLNDRLGEADDWPHGSVESTTAQPVGGPDSLASDVFTLTVSCRDGIGPTKPVQLLVKLHHPKTHQRDVAGYAAEVFFYRELAPAVGVPVPRTYVADVDESSGRLVIIQEFLSDGVIGSSDRSFRLDELERVLKSLATLHARWWRASKLTTIVGVRQFHPVIRRAIANLKAGTLDAVAFASRYRHIIHPDMQKVYASMPDWMNRVADGFSPVYTLVHLDCSAKNIFIPDDPERLPVLFDWALFRCGSPALDVATLLCYSMDPNDHGYLQKLALGYHDMLMERDIRDYPFDVFWDDFRYACLWRLAAPVFNAAVGSSERTAHAAMIIPRLDSTVLQTNALDLLDSL